jgi:hypothetical protein
MLKDLAPTLIATFLANKVASYEMRPKFWLLVYGALNNLSIIADMFIPSVIASQYLLPAAVFTSILKQSAILMFFVARASALQHFATHQNLAEFTKKFNSFGMVIFTVATALGIGFTSLCQDFYVQLGVVLLCSAINIALLHQSMAPIAFRVINETTGEILVRSYIRSNYLKVPTPEAVARELGVWGTVGDSMRCMMFVNPPVTILSIRSDSLDSDVLVNGSHLNFVIGVWELPLKISLLQERRRIFAGKPLADETLSVVLLVGKGCQPRQLFCAHLMMQAALEECDSMDGVKAFLRSCAANSKLWLQKSDLFALHLSECGWDAKNVTMDPVDMRIAVLKRTSDDDDDGGDDEESSATLND